MLCLAGRAADFRLFRSQTLFNHSNWSHSTINTKQIWTTKEKGDLFDLQIEISSAYGSKWSIGSHHWINHITLLYASEDLCSISHYWCYIIRLYNNNNSFYSSQQLGIFRLCPSVSLHSPSTGLHIRFLVPSHHFYFPSRGPLYTPTDTQWSGSPMGQYF